MLRNREATDQIKSLIEGLLSDDYIQALYRKEMLEMSKDGFVMLHLDYSEDEDEVEGEGKTVAVPVDAPMKIVTRFFNKEYILNALGFGTYIVQLGIGEIEDHGNGLVGAQYGFMSMYFNEEFEMNTFDIHPRRR